MVRRKKPTSSEAFNDAMKAIPQNLPIIIIIGLAAKILKRERRMITLEVDEWKLLILIGIANLLFTVAAVIMLGVVLTR